MTIDVSSLLSASARAAGPPTDPRENGPWRPSVRGDDRVCPVGLLQRKQPIGLYQIPCQEEAGNGSRHPGLPGSPAIQVICEGITAND